MATRTGLVVPQGKNSADTVERALEVSHDADPLARRLAAKNLCPCHVQEDRPEVWQRLMELAADTDPDVRAEALHGLTDGAPAHYRPRIDRLLEDLARDRDRKVRKFANYLLARQRRTGRFNVG